MKTWFPSVLAALVALVTALTPSLQALLSSHPIASSIVGALGVIFAHLLPSPLSQAPTSSLK